MTEVNQGDARLGDAAKWLAGSLPIAVGALTFAGLSGSELGRVIRVAPTPYVLGLFALFAAVGLGVAAFYLPSSSRWLLTGGIVAFALGAGTLVTLHAVASSKQDRPTVSAGLARDAHGPIAKISMHAAGLNPAQYVFLVVQGQNSQRRLDAESAEFSADQSPIPLGQYSKQRIYSGRIGASPSGQADSTFEIRLADSLYEQYVVQAAILNSRNGKQLENEIMNGSIGTGRFVCDPATTQVSCITVLLPWPPLAKNASRTAGNR
ncbi:MAG: hypothetical protein WCB04_15400 [Mycobacteriales bacterium]